jgi:mannose-6-phosphate isomerase-like protein (cupin superfamily)
VVRDSSLAGALLAEGTSHVIKKSWGYEEILYNGSHCMKLLVYEKPIASSLHYHRVKHEVFWVASGEFELERQFSFSREYIPPTENRLVPGDYVQIPPGTHHRIRCIKPGTIVEGSTHDDPEDCVRIIPSET